MTEKKHVDADDIEKADNIVNAEEIGFSIIRAL